MSQPHHTVAMVHYEMGKVTGVIVQALQASAQLHASIREALSRLDDSPIARDRLLDDLGKALTKYETQMNIQYDSL